MRLTTLNGKMLFGVFRLTTLHYCVMHLQGKVLSRLGLKLHFLNSTSFRFRFYFSADRTIMHLA